MPPQFRRPAAETFVSSDQIFQFDRQNEPPDVEIYEFTDLRIYELKIISKLPIKFVNS
jgi:hypothetical protein